MKNKKPTRTYNLTDSIIKAIDKAYEIESKRRGENKNTIVINCIICGLKELYNIEI